MKEPKTINGYINLLTQVEEIQISKLKGYDKLTKKQKMNLGIIRGDIGNGLVEFTWEETEKDKSMELLDCRNKQPDCLTNSDTQTCKEDCEMYKPKGRPVK